MLLTPFENNHIFKVKNSGTVVATSQLAWCWMCNLPRMECARRIWVLLSKNQVQKC